MHSPLLDHIALFVTLDPSEKELLATALDYRSVRKKELLLEEGQICQYQYFIIKGCCRTYIINEKGTEQTLQFSIENWWITDYMSFDNQQPAYCYIQATENADVIAISKTAMNELLFRIPKLERYFRLILQRAFAASQIRIKYLFTMNAEERYHHMNSRYPEFVQRVPQYMLASYLDFSAEFMSKIRAGKV